MSEEPAPPSLAGRKSEVSRSQRTWPTWVTMFLILPAGIIAVSAISLLLAALMTGGPSPADQEALQSWFREISTSPKGVLILIAPGQLFFLALAILAGLPSPDKLSTRLGLVRPRYSLGVWAILCLGTPVVQIAGAFFAQLFFDLSEPSEQMELMSGLFTSQSGFLGVTLLLFLAAVMPGISEELFFRGYVRVGLGRRFGFAVAIFVPALIFAMVHGDPMHATAVLPLGLWFGCLAWWSRSAIPSIFAHIVNNLTAILVARQAAALEAGMGEVDPAAEVAGGPLAEIGTIYLIGYGLSLGCLLVGLASLRRHREAR